MDSGQCGHPGVLALPNVAKGVKPDPGLAPIQNLPMAELTVRV